MDALPLAALAEQWPLAAGWLAYAVLHSVLAGERCKRAAAARWPVLARRYRLAFNVLSVLLLLPLLAAVWLQPGPVWWSLAGPPRIAVDALSLLVLVLLLVAGPGYDLRHFLGLTPDSAPTGATLRISRWHRHVRHPWYTAALLLIWSRDMSSAWLLSALCISAYFVVGSRLEERKLITEFGEAYRRYRQRVPALLPWPGRRLGAAEAAALESLAAQDAGARDER